MRTELFMYFCIKYYIGAQGEDLSKVKVLKPRGRLCYRPYYGNGPGVCFTKVFRT